VLRLRTAAVGLNEIARRIGVAPSTVRQFCAAAYLRTCIVAFIEDPGIGMSVPPGTGPVGWFPLAPGEVYWPSYTRDEGPRVRNPSCSKASLLGT
jgi:hypothetical protein